MSTDKEERKHIYEKWDYPYRASMKEPLLKNWIYKTDDIEVWKMLRNPSKRKAEALKGWEFHAEQVGVLRPWWIQVRVWRRALANKLDRMYKWVEIES